jgi:uncharacterized protein YjiK
MTRAVAFLLALSCFGVAVAAPPPDTLTRLRAFKLDIGLREVSGLAPAGPNSVFAHSDEFAIVHEIDVDTGAIMRSFAFGKPTISGDFEGISRVKDEIWLVTSDGKLLEGEIKKHGKRTRFNMFDTGVGKYCEIEGLAAADGPDAFYLLCKKLLKDNAQNLRIYEWSLSQRFAEPKLVVDVPLASLAPAGAAANFHPADLVRDPKSGNFWILNASGSLLEITGAGNFVRFIALDPALHPQAEGLSFLPNGDIAIADEGKKREGVLAIYRDR